MRPVSRLQLYVVSSRWRCSLTKPQRSDRRRLNSAVSSSTIKTLDYDQDRRYGPLFLSVWIYSSSVGQKRVGLILSVPTVGAIFLIKSNQPLKKKKKEKKTAPDFSLTSLNSLF